LKNKVAFIAVIFAPNGSLRFGINVISLNGTLLNYDYPDSRLSLSLFMSMLEILEGFTLNMRKSYFYI
jgi:hypothetical protein